MKINTINKMKTLITLAIVLFSFTSLQAEGFNFQFEEESYINDIPFDTFSVASKISFEQAIGVNFKIEEEAYVNDIPFDTEKIAEDVLFNIEKETLPQLTAEEYIDDIPFNTSKIAAQHMCK